MEPMISSCTSLPSDPTATVLCPTVSPLSFSSITATTAAPWPSTSPQPLDLVFPEDFAAAAVGGAEEEDATGAGKAVAEGSVGEEEALSVITVEE